VALTKQEVQLLIRAQADIERARREINGFLRGLPKEAAAAGAASSAALSRSFSGVGSSLTAAGQSLSLGLTLPIVGAGVAIAKLSNDFDQSMSLIRGLVGASAEQVAAWREEILALAPEVVKSPKELADALYFVASAGVDAEQAMSVVEASAKAATAGLGDTQVIANAVTSVMNAYGASNISAAEATSILVATVREGKAEAPELAAAIGRVIPIAAQMGVSFDQVGGALAAMTQLGLDTDEAVTALRGVLTQILSPTAEAKEALKEYGLTAEGLRMQVQDEGLLAALTTLSTTFGGNSEALSKVFPEIRGLVGFLSIMGENAGTAQQIFADLAATTEQDLASAFDAATQRADHGFRQALIELQVAAIRLGDTLAPIIMDVIIPAIDAGVVVVEQLVAQFSALPGPVQGGIVAFVALMALLGPLLMVLGSVASGIGALITLAPLLGAAFTLATGPVGLLVIALAGVTAAAFLMWKNWDSIWPRLKEAPVAIFNWLRDNWLNALIFLFVPGGPLIVLFKNWDSIWRMMPGPVQTAMNAVAGIVEAIVNGIVATFERGVNLVISAINDILAAARKVDNMLPEALSPWDVPGDISPISIERVNFTNRSAGPGFGGALREVFTAASDGLATLRGASLGASEGLGALNPQLGGGGGGGGAGGAGGGGGGLAANSLAAADGLAALNGAFQDWLLLNPGGTIEEFVARLELAQEGLLGAGSGAQQAAADAFRARVELHKLALVLGERGISAEAFIAQQFLTRVRDNFADAGVAINDGLLHILSAARDFSVDMIRIANALLERGRDLARARGEPINSVAFLNVDLPGGDRISIGGNLTDEGLRRIEERHGVDIPDEAITRHEPSPRIPRGFSSSQQQMVVNNYAPITVHTQLGVEDALNQIGDQLR